MDQSENLKKLGIDTTERLTIGGQTRDAVDTKAARMGRRMTFMGMHHE